MASLKLKPLTKRRKSARDPEEDETGPPYGARVNKWPQKGQWRQFFKILTKKEKIAFFSFFVLAIFAFVFLLFNFYFKNTEDMPAHGGTYIEGLIGQPRFINPLYANSDVDRDLTQLIFSGLMKYDQNLQIVPDLVQDYEISEDRKVYTFYLKENILWQDKTPLTVDDVIFTIKTIQSPEYKSPFRANWIGVEVEKIDELGVRFKLKGPYSAFLENCTVKILPQHIWQDVSPQNFPLATYNLDPIGTGPYKLKEVKKEKSERVGSLTLVSSPYYFGKKPNISKIKFLFFDNEEKLIKEARKGTIKGLSLSSFNGVGEKWQNYYLALPRYFAVFFNPEKSAVLAEKKVRIALSHGTDKEEVAKKILNLPENSPILDRVITHSPVLPKIYGLEEPSEIYEFDIEKAKGILDEAGFKETQNSFREKEIKKEPAFSFKSDLKKDSQGLEVRKLQECLAGFPDIYPEGEVTGYFGQKTRKAVIGFQEKYKAEILDPWGFTKGTGLVGKSTRAKLNEICIETPQETLPLKFSLVTVDQPRLAEVANLLKHQWEALGAEVEIQKIPLFQLEHDFIKPRNYDALLFGEVLGAIPDLLPFWHSSQIKDPGLNLAMFEDEEADDLLEEIRESSIPEELAEKLVLFQDILITQSPAVFLYSPDYIYLVSKEVKGIEIKKIADPSKRFSNIENWYIRTSRRFAPREP